MNATKLLADVDPVKDIFGATIAPPVQGIPTEPTQAVSSIIVTGIRIFLVIGGVTALFFLLWGAYDYINSGGEKDKIEKAQQKMTQAAIGLILMIVALTVFVVLTSTVLGIIKIDSSGNWIFPLPRIGAP